MASGVCWWVCVQLGEEDREERQRKKQAWEENKAQLERALKAPWEQRGSGGGGSRGGRGAQRDGGWLQLACVIICAGVHRGGCPTP
jgi:hypothetical protein